MTEKVRNKEGEMGHRERNETKKGKWSIEKRMTFTECHSLLSILCRNVFDSQ
jgi:hypothetical protein